MNAQDIDWTQAPEGYDYYIVDTDGEYPAEFHHKEQNLLLGTIYVDSAGRNWIGDDTRIEIYERPEPEQSDESVRLRCVKGDGQYFTVGKVYTPIGREDTGSYVLQTDDIGITLIVDNDELEVSGMPFAGIFKVVSDESDESEEDTQEVTHLRCISSDSRDNSFSVGTVYEVLEVNSAGNYVLRGDDHCPWNIHSESLEFFGSPDVGRFEIAYVGDSVKPEPEKTGPVFGDIVHIGGTPHVFTCVDGDSDLVLYDQDGDVRYAQLFEIDEYAQEKLTIREKILKDLEDYHGGPREDKYEYRINYSVPDLLDFIIENKDNWQ